MKIELAKRHYGVHKPVKEAEIPGEFSDYATLMPMPRSRPDEFAIDEDKLLAALPDNFLPVAAKSVLLCVSDEGGGTGQTGLSRFRNWAKYFDAYCLNLMKPQEAATTVAGTGATGA
jgi:hypothetical protein